MCNFDAHKFDLETLYICTSTALAQNWEKSDPNSGQTKNDIIVESYVFHQVHTKFRDGHTGRKKILK